MSEIMINSDINYYIICLLEDAMEIALYVYYIAHGRMQVLPGGRQFFFEFRRIACREAGCGAWLSHVLARGLGGMHPQKYF